MLKWIFAILLLANAGAAVVISLQTPHKVDLATYELNAQRVRLVGPMTMQIFKNSKALI